MIGKQKKAIGSKKLRKRQATHGEKWADYTASAPHHINQKDYKLAATFREQMLLLDQNLWMWI
jgi:hypothetical protein